MSNLESDESTISANAVQSVMSEEALVGVQFNVPVSIQW